MIINITLIKCITYLSIGKQWNIMEWRDGLAIAITWQ